MSFQVEGAASARVPRWTQLGGAKANRLEHSGQGRGRSRGRTNVLPSSCEDQNCPQTFQYVLCLSKEVSKYEVADSELLELSHGSLNSHRNKYLLVA